MASLSNIKKRIATIQKTSKITQAMKLVSTVKIQRQKNEFVKISNFMDSLYKMLQDLARSSMYESVFTNTPKSDYQSDLNGTVVTTYTGPYPYIYYVKGSDTNNVDDIVNAYVGTVSSNASGRLMSYSEANGLSIEVRDIGASYWLGSADSNSSVWDVISGGAMVSNYYYVNRGVRPVVILPLSEIWKGASFWKKPVPEK